MTNDERTVRELFVALDTGDAVRALALLTEDVRFRFGNAKTTIGHQGFVASATALQEVVASLHHELLSVWTVSKPAPVVICEMSVTYQRHDAHHLTLPCVNVVRLRGGQIADYRIYMDMHPLLSP
jgi:ketosteroid isomerase-like protein